MILDVRRKAHRYGEVFSSAFNIRGSPNPMLCVIGSAIHDRLPKERRLSLSSTGEYIIPVTVSLFEWPVEGDVSVDWGSVRCWASPEQRLDLGLAAWGVS